MSPLSIGHHHRTIEWLFAAIVQSSSDAIWVENLEGAVVSWNPGAERMFGIRAAEAIGQTGKNLVPPDLQAQYAARAERVRTGDEVASHDTVRLDHDGDRLDVSVSLTPVRTSDGRVAGMTVMARDISDRCAVERELARTREELEVHAAELQRSNTALEQFVYVVSHDLAEPLRAIAGFLQLLERRYGDRLDDDGRRYVRRSVEGAGRMRRLMDDLLAYSRAWRDPAPAENIDLANVVRDALDDLEAAIAETGADVVCDALPVVVGDAARLRQLVQNLVANALKFRAPDAGPPRIEIRAGRQDDRLRVSVLDDGIGVDPRFTDRIFLIFKRVHGRDAYPGTGMGLATCRQIVESHGGRIWCEPRPTGGSAFHFTLIPASEAA